MTSPHRIDVLHDGHVPLSGKRGGGVVEAAASTDRKRLLRQ